MLAGSINREGINDELFICGNLNARRHLSMSVFFLYNGVVIACTYTLFSVISLNEILVFLRLLVNYQTSRIVLTVRSKNFSEVDRVGRNNLQSIGKTLNKCIMSFFKYNTKRSE